MTDEQFEKIVKESKSQGNSQNFCHHFVVELIDQRQHADWIIKLFVEGNNWIDGGEAVQAPQDSDWCWCIYCSGSSEPFENLKAAKVVNGHYHLLDCQWLIAYDYYMEHNLGAKIDPYM